MNAALQSVASVPTSHQLTGQFNASPRWVDVTPELARQYLTHNTDNRRLRRTSVVELAGAMRRGEWVPNGNAIAFDQDGLLIDGQHRLHAVIEAGVTAKMLVVRGVDSAAFTVTDRGLKRNVRDDLSRRGVANATQVAAALTALWRFETTGRFRTVHPHPTSTEILNLFEREPEIVESVKGMERVSGHIGVRSATISVLYHVLPLIDADDAAYFFDRLADGANLDADHPIYRLRKRIVESSGATKRLNGDEIGALMIKAWNFYREGRQVSVLSWRPGGANPEGYPEPK